MHVFQFVYFLILYCPPFQSYSGTIFAALIVDLAANLAIEINITMIQLVFDNLLKYALLFFNFSERWVKVQMMWCSLESVFTGGYGIMFPVTVIVHLLLTPLNHTCLHLI